MYFHTDTLGITKIITTFTCTDYFNKTIHKMKKLKDIHNTLPDLLNNHRPLDRIIAIVFAKEQTR